MPVFEYVAIDASGKKSKGIIEADSAKQVRQQLRGSQLSPIEVNESSQSESTKAVFHRDKLSVSAVALITRQIATLIAAGQPIESSLQAVAKQSHKNAVKKVLLAVRSKVLEGYSLSDALNEYPRVFNKMYSATVHAGEQSGILATVMLRLADYMESKQALQQKTKIALIYPVLLTVVSIILVAGLLTFVVPQIVQVFEGFDQELPQVTQMLISVSEFFQNHGLVTIGLIFVCTIAFQQLLKLDWFVVIWDRFLLSLPFLRHLIILSNSARYSRTLSILVSSGVPALEAMEISSEVVINTEIKQSVVTASETVREGGKISDSLEKTGYFSPLVVQLVANGESSGKLGEMLERSAQTEENEFEGITAMFIGLFEPGMILLMGGVVLVIVLAILLPIFDMNDLIQ